MNAITLEIQGSSSLDLSMTSDPTLTLGLERSTGTNNYESLVNKPSINSVELIGDKSFEDLGDVPLTNTEIQAIFNRIFNN